ncbi:MAG: serine/threonine-protein kinase, partial [Anaerolineae bacterium]
MPDTLPSRLGRYVLQSELGRGGFAVVYRALDTSLEREIALKVLKPGWTDDQKAVQRFLREADLTSRLIHPHIVRILDCGQDEGRLFIAMERIEGRSLQQFVADDGPATWTQMLTIMGQVAQALDFAHQQGMVHRDVKPANILLDESQPDAPVRAVLTDFGLVRGTEQATLSIGLTSGSLLGTPEYIAPEIWQGQSATPATDLYALACVVFYLLTGRALFGATNPMAVLMRHQQGPVFSENWP